ncbi:MAG: N,N-dimethyltransferase [Phycisphaerae bacterium]|nr:MAG: N,N-dimethyltransferase [Phycisphaerae bacterium]
MQRHVDFYAIPRLYDILHAEGTAHDVRVLRRLRRRFVPGRIVGETWLEPACGTARYLREAARFGLRGVGFDTHPSMLAYARRVRRLPPRPGVARQGRVTLFRARMEDFDRAHAVPPIHLAFNLINTIRHLATDRAMLDHLAAVARVLAPGGVYIVGLGLAAYGHESITEDVWSGRRGPVRVSQVVQYIPASGSRGEGARAERVISHLTVRTGSRDRHLDSTYALRSYNLAQWTAIIDRSPLCLLGTSDADGRPVTPRDPGYFLWVLGARG